MIQRGRVSPAVLACCCPCQDGINVCERLVSASLSCSCLHTGPSCPVLSCSNSEFVPENWRADKRLMPLAAQTGPIDAETTAYQLMWTAASVRLLYCTPPSTLKGCRLSTIKKLMISDDDQNLLQLQCVLASCGSEQPAVIASRT
nr:unnamed protein product [Digitaria exilis]